MNETQLKEKIDEMTQSIRTLGSVAVAFSGGVDSTVVAALAYNALVDKALAVTIDSPLFLREELEHAKSIAAHIGIRHEIIQHDELKVPEFRGNPKNRCYICKRSRYTAVMKHLEGRGFKAVLEGTNKSDLGQYRPGLKASNELGVVKPLLEAGLSKADTRAAARLLGLPNADMPSNSCLASRIPYNEELTRERLERVLDAELFIKRETGVKTLRVRDHGGLARIEVGSHERSLLFSEEKMDRVAERLKELGFRWAALDLEGYRFGSYDREQKKPA